MTDEIRILIGAALLVLSIACFAIGFRAWIKASAIETNDPQAGEK